MDSEVARFLFGVIIGAGFASLWWTSFVFGGWIWAPTTAITVIVIIFGMIYLAVNAFD